MALTDTPTKNAMCSAYAGLAVYAAAHSAYPATAANEITSTGAARGVITWGSPSSGSIVGTATVSIGYPGSGSVTFSSVGCWSNSTVGGGTFRDGGDITDITYNGNGTATVTVTYSQS